MKLLSYLTFNICQLPIIAHLPFVKNVADGYAGKMLNGKWKMENASGGSV